MNKTRYKNHIAWTTENNEYGVRIFKNEICIWRGHGYSGSSVSCTLKEWLDKTQQGIHVRQLICCDLGFDVSIEIEEYLRKEE